MKNKKFSEEAHTSCCSSVLTFELITFFIISFLKWLIVVYIPCLTAIDGNIEKKKKPKMTTTTTTTTRN